MKIKTILGVFTLLSVSSLSAQQGSTEIWYQQPAKEWMEAIPMGNGRLSAMIYGGIHQERLALNEISLWSGRHDSTSNDLCGREALDQMRQYIFDNNYEAADSMGWRTLHGRMTTFGTHVPLGDMVIDFDYPAGIISDYKRSLDLSKAITSVSFKCGDIHYTREYIASYPDNVFAIRLTADKKGCISTEVGFELLREATFNADNNDVTFNGTVDFPLHGPGGVSFYGDVKVSPRGGKVSHTDKTVKIENADEVTLYFNVRTNYMTDKYKEQCTAELNKASGKPYNAMKEAHIADYAHLFDRVSIDLGTAANPQLPTDTRLHLAQAGAADPDFDALFFQYGRYMLIASSRKHDIPLCANLQGIWNDNGACNMPWTCDYHLDINIEQNYWSANRANLAECNEPLFSYLQLLAKHGKETAQKMYGSRGWVAHSVCNAWGYTAPGWGVSWGMNVTGGAWLATHLWMHYLYTHDTEYLRTIGYPLIKETALFFMDYMTTDPRTGYLVTGPSISPENGYVSPRGNHLCLDLMPTIDRAVVYDIYTACIEASKILGVDKKMRAQLNKDIKRLPPIMIGSDGQIQEWYSDVRRADPAHRHSSHLLAMFPLDQISYTHTPELMQAAKKGLVMQTSSPTWEDTEWSTANMICFYARMKEAETSYNWIQNLFKRFTRENLMTVSPAGIAMAEYDIFSFDATEASVAGMCELLLQSYDGFIELLPALPTAWHTGSVKGICAEGALVADLAWKDMKMQTAKLTAGEDSKFKLRVPTGATPTFSIAGKVIKPTVKENLAQISLKAGETLEIKF
ncbi:MAG: glycoside hydrolase N-terminal domain-containing protein [Coprobacter sp.]|nr:glycoside hydrolase N-terminal domain-containing protein [Coprobacter sp.]